jgi:hypothetical protein
VIKINGDQYDVRFFGGHHQRALVEKSHIRSISVNIHTLQVKRTSSWNKACEELRRHQDLLEKMHNNEFTYPDSSSDEDDDDDDDDDNAGKAEASKPVNRPCESSRSYKTQVLCVKCVK